MMTRGKALLLLTITFLGTVFAFSAIIAFYVLGNDLAVLWSALTCCYALFNVHLHVLFFRNKIQDFYNIKSLTRIKDFGFVSALISFGFAAFYIFLIIYYKYPLSEPVNESHVVPTVWMLLATKYSYMLFSASDAYMYHLGTSGRYLLEP